MAETLGSLIDKLSIKSIREFYLGRMLRSKKGASRQHLQDKRVILKRQKKALLAEIEQFIQTAHQTGTVLKDEKLKLYNKPEQMNRIGKISSLSRGIDALTKKNFELWQLEDEARKEDVSLASIGRVKRKIDAVNQQRNDLMDRIDQLLEAELKKKKR